MKYPNWLAAVRTPMTASRRPGSVPNANAPATRVRPPTTRDRLASRTVVTTIELRAVSVATTRTAAPAASQGSSWSGCRVRSIREASTLPGM
jgi:hypothetical protein